MARALIVACGCRGRELGRSLVDRGWQVRGTSRSAAGAAAIRQAGLDAALADPSDPGTVSDQLGDVAVLVLLLGSVRGDAAELATLCGERLDAVLERVVDGPVRGVVLETGGAGAGEPLARAAGRLADWSERWHTPVATLEMPPDGGKEWTRQAAGAVTGALRGA